jgi:hypothetical protein
MTGINLNVTGTEQVYKVWDIVTTCKRHRLSYDMNMSSIYMIYTRFIYPFGIGVYQVYIIYISVIYLAYFIYPGICQVYALILPGGWC